MEEVEAVLKNRPLTYCSLDIKDMDPITPSHLLLGRSTISLPYQDVQDDEDDDPTYGDDTDLRQRTKRQALLFKHFWTRWQKEYLTALREFHRSTGNNTQVVGVGDVVQIHDDTPRIQWRLGVIEGLNKGNDGLIRSVNIRTSTGRTNRPLAKLYPLEVTAAERPSVEPKSPGESTNEDSVAPRPSRHAAAEGRQKVKRWVGALCGPPEDVVD